MEDLNTLASVSDPGGVSLLRSQGSVLQNSLNKFRISLIVTDVSSIVRKVVVPRSQNFLDTYVCNYAYN